MSAFRPARGRWLRTVSLALLGVACSCRREPATPAPMPRAPAAEVHAAPSLAPAPEGPAGSAAADENRAVGEPSAPAEPPVGPPPSRCAVHGAPVVVTTAARVPGPVSVAQHGDRTAVAWMDGPIGKVAVLDRDGRPVAPERSVNEAGSHAQPSVQAAGAGFVVTYVHRQGPAMRGHLVGRTLGLDAALGEPVAIARDVCSPFGYPRVAARADVAVVVATTGYEGRGIRLLRWFLPAGSVEPTAAPGTAEQSGPIAVGPAPDGFLALWGEPAGSDSTRHRAQRLDADGRPVGTPETVSLHPESPVWLIAGRPFSARVRGGAFELRGAGAARETAWTALEAGVRVTGGSVVEQGGRAWARLEAGGAPTLVVPLTDDGTTAGPPSALPAATFAIDGAAGVAVGFRGSSRELVFHALACTAD